MKPHKFPQAFRTLTMPAGQEGGDLPTWTNGREVLSCWRGGWRERLTFLFTGRIWLWVTSGHTQPPVCVTTEDPDFRPAISNDPVQPGKRVTEQDVRAMVRATIKRARKIGSAT